MSHPTLMQLLAHRHSPDAEVATHLADCLACRRQVEELEEALGQVLEPDLPPLDEAVSEAWISAAVDGTAPIDRAVPRPRVPWWSGWASAAALMLSAGALAMSTAVWWSARDPAPVIAPPPVQSPAAPAAPSSTAPPSRTAPQVTPPPADVAPPGQQRLPSGSERPPPPATSPPELVAPPPVAFDETLFQEAADALARGDSDVARALLEILVELHPDADLRPLLLVEEGLALRLTDPAAAVPRFAEALSIDPEGPLAADCRQWLCEAAPDHEQCR